MEENEKNETKFKAIPVTGSSSYNKNEKSQKNSAEVRKKFNQLNTKAIRPYFFRTVFFAVLLHSTHSFALLQNKKSTTVKY